MIQSQLLQSFLQKQRRRCEQLLRENPKALIHEIVNEELDTILSAENIEEIFEAEQVKTIQQLSRKRFNFWKKQIKENPKEVIKNKILMERSKAENLTEAELLIKANQEDPTFYLH